MKLHLYSTPIPRLMKGEVMADCGKWLYDAKAACTWDAQVMGARLELPKGICKKCLLAAKSERYTYAIAEAKEMREDEQLFT